MAWVRPAPLESFPPAKARPAPTLRSETLYRRIKKGSGVPLVQQCLSRSNIYRAGWLHVRLLAPRRGLGERRVHAAPLAADDRPAGVPRPSVGGQAASPSFQLLLLSNLNATSARDSMYTGIVSKAKRDRAPAARARALTRRGPARARSWRCTSNGSARATTARAVSPPGHTPAGRTRTLPSPSPSMPSRPTRHAPCLSPCGPCAEHPISGRKERTAGTV